MTDTIIFTEIYNCGMIAKVMLKSFFQFHPDREIHVFGAAQDLIDLGEMFPLQSLRTYDAIDIGDKFTVGHKGTAHVFASAFTRWKGKKIIHIDSDVIFKQESISLIENEFEKGFDIVGSRRCYKNNPGGVTGLDDIPDTISTYFVGFNSAKIPDYDFETFCKMWQGAYHPWSYKILDFGDPVTHCALHNGATIKFLDQNLIGGQDENGKKTSSYKSNLHLDMGSHLCHMGGVGSGYAVYLEKSRPEKSYADWALIRFALFCKLFYDKDIQTSKSEPVFDKDGRWVSGGWNNEILELIKTDLNA